MTDLGMAHYTVAITSVRLCIIVIQTPVTLVWQEVSVSKIALNIIYIYIYIYIYTYYGPSFSIESSLYLYKVFASFTLHLIFCIPLCTP